MKNTRKRAVAAIKSPPLIVARHGDRALAASRDALAHRHRQAVTPCPAAFVEIHPAL